MQCYVIDYDYARVTDQLVDYLNALTPVYIVGYFDKGALVNPDEEYNEHSLAIICNDNDFIILDT